MLANSWKRSLRSFLKEFLFSYSSKIDFNLKLIFFFLFLSFVSLFICVFLFPLKKAFQSSWILMEIYCWVFDSQKECISITGKWQFSPQWHSSRPIKGHHSEPQPVEVLHPECQYLLHDLSF